MRRKTLCNVTCVCCVLVLSGCATVTDPVHVKRPENDQPFKGVVSGKKVLILEPFITTCTTNTEAPVPPESCGAISLANLLENSARSVCQEVGASTIVARENVAVQNGSAKEALQTLASKGPVLLSYYKDKSELLTSLQALAQATGAEMICAYSILVKVGARSGWDPNTGAIWQGTSSTSVKAVLVSTHTGKILWGNEMFVRTVASDSQCIKAAKILFAEAK